MATRRPRRFVYGQVAWMLGTVLALAALGEPSLETFFIGSLVGFLVLAELTAPVNVAPKWRSRLKWVALAGLLGFGALMVRSVLEFLPEGLL